MWSMRSKDKGELSMVLEVETEAETQLMNGLGPYRSDLMIRHSYFTLSTIWNLLYF